MRRHCVVIGNGMVGARFAEEVRRHDPAARALAITVLGAEHRPAYNRVLLPNLLSGVMQDEDLTHDAHGGHVGADVTVRASATAIRLDLGRRAVVTSDGDELRYDDLVLATGARARVPDIRGIWAFASDGDGEDQLCQEVTALRTIADARRLANLAATARRKHGRIAVLGGGVLGIEAARALAARGTAVTVLHRGGHLMDRQLDAPAGRALAAAARAMGIDVRLAVDAVRWEPGQGLWVRAADGAGREPAAEPGAAPGTELVRADGLLLSAGTIPETRLAAAGGLRLVPSGAIAIDDALTTSDPHVYAIGDCAGHPGAAGGLVQPGWEQAAVLARRLAGAQPRARYRGSSCVTRLKATGIDLTCAGDPFPEPGDPEYEVLRFEDSGRYAKLVLQDDRVTGAIMLGFPDAAAGIVQLYDRDAPVPADRLALLLGRALPADGGCAGAPAALPDHAIVCRCNMVTKAQLRDAWYAGATSRAALTAATRAATGCGGCGSDIDAFADWLTRTDPGAPPAIHGPGASGSTPNEDPSARPRTPVITEPTEMNVTSEFFPTPRSSPAQQEAMFP
jgi:assimilatory nitrate reductase electron transfer subunit